MSFLDNVSPLDLTYISVAIFVAVAVVVLYKFVLEPKITYPLPNEQDEGIWRIPLPQLGIVNEGRTTTARRYLQSHWALAIESAEENNKKALIAERDDQMNYHWFAQKCGNQNYLYCFDENPLDPQFHMREDRGGRFGGETPVRFIYGIRDSTARGEQDGFKLIGVKLSPEVFKFTEEERKWTDLRLEAAAFLRIASENLGKIKFLHERNKSLDSLLEEERGKHAETRSKLDRALSALEQKTLSVPEGIKVPGAFVQRLKEWFTWPQLLSAGGFYFIVSPLLMSAFFNTATPPTTTYITAGITIAGFFIIPVFRKIFGRWL